MWKNLYNNKQYENEQRCHEPAAFIFENCSQFTCSVLLSKYLTQPNNTESTCYDDSHGMYCTHQCQAQKIFYRVLIPILIAHCRKENRKHKYAIWSAYNAVLIKQEEVKRQQTTYKLWKRRLEKQDRHSKGHKKYIYCRKGQLIGCAKLCERRQYQMPQWRVTLIVWYLKKYLLYSSRTCNRPRLSFIKPRFMKKRYSANTKQVYYQRYNIALSMLFAERPAFKFQNKTLHFKIHYQPCYNPRRIRICRLSGSWQGGRPCSLGSYPCGTLL